MQPLKVIIENWQETSFLTTWIPQIVGIIALIVSLYASYLTRVQFAQSTRPYVSVSSFLSLHNHQQINNVVIYSVLNGPAKIKSIVLTLSYKNEKVEVKMANLVRFPNDKAEWTYQFAYDDFVRLEALANGDGENFLRSVELKYTHLDGGKEYFYKMVQKYVGDGPTWQNSSEDAN